MTVFPQGTLIWQRFPNVSCLRTYYGKKGGNRLIPNVKILLGYDSICMFNLMEITRVIVFFSYYMIALLRFFQKRSFVLSSEHENQNVATIGTLLDQFKLRCKEKGLARFSQCLPRT